MDDDEGLFGVDLDRRQAGLKAGHKAVKRKQGEYNIPSAGTVWVWKRVGPSRLGGVSLALSGLGVTAALCCGPVRVLRAVLEGQGVVRSRKIELQSAWPLTLLQSRHNNEAHYLFIKNINVPGGRGLRPRTPEVNK